MNTYAIFRTFDLFDLDEDAYTLVEDLEESADGIYHVKLEGECLPRRVHVADDGEYYFYPDSPLDDEGWLFLAGDTDSDLIYDVVTHPEFPLSAAHTLLHYTSSCQWELLVREGLLDRPDVTRDLVQTLLNEDTGICEECGSVSVLAAERLAGLGKEEADR